LHTAGAAAAGAAYTGAFVTIASISAANAVVAQPATAAIIAAGMPARTPKSTIETPCTFCE
jgi:hypothetical protein